MSARRRIGGDDYSKRYSLSEVETLGSTFSVAATFAKFEDELPKRFSVGISNIHVTP